MGLRPRKLCATGQRRIGHKGEKMRTLLPSRLLGNQVVGNVGLFYVCYRLSQHAWNVMPTARNARGIDIIAYNKDGSRVVTIQVKSLNKRNPVPLGSNLEHLFANFVVVCTNVGTIEPECFVMTPTEIKKLTHRSVKNGKVSFWLQRPAYETDEFRDKWERIGSGIHQANCLREKIVAMAKLKGEVVPEESILEKADLLENWSKDEVLKLVAKEADKMTS
jgi:hypothetical protein